MELIAERYLVRIRFYILHERERKRERERERERVFGDFSIVHAERL